MNFVYPDGNPTMGIDSRSAASIEEQATRMLQQSASTVRRGAEVMPIGDVHTYKEVRSKMVDLVDSKVALTEAQFKELFRDLRRTQHFARSVSLPEKGKLQFKANALGKDTDSKREELLIEGLVNELDDDRFVKILMFKQAERTMLGYEPPTFADARQWIAILFETTLRNMNEEIKLLKNSKPRTRSELFLRLYLLAKVAGADVEFHHTDFRSGGPS
mmetsp:Transcript_24049/g.42443  ORF Transcript_24049/g.42443 Transcript_24049/m.42443 type:complete len:217 (+) Transcript_24049:421-1071(+)